MASTEIKHLDIHVDGDPIVVLLLVRIEAITEPKRLKCGWDRGHVGTLDGIGKLVYVTLSDRGTRSQGSRCRCELDSLATFQNAEVCLDSICALDGRRNSLTSEDEQVAC